MSEINTAAVAALMRSCYTLDDIASIYQVSLDVITASARAAGLIAEPKPVPPVDNTEQVNIRPDALSQNETRRIEPQEPNGRIRPHRKRPKAGRSATK